MNGEELYAFACRIAGAPTSADSPGNRRAVRIFNAKDKLMRAIAECRSQWRDPETDRVVQEAARELLEAVGVEVDT